MTRDEYLRASADWVVRVEQQPDFDGLWTATIDGLPEFYTLGATSGEARSCVPAAIGELFDSYARLGLAPPSPAVGDGKEEG